MKTKKNKQVVYLLIVENIHTKERSFAGELKTLPADKSAFLFAINERFEANVKYYAEEKTYWKANNLNLQNFDL
jgi:hypothetical protein